ncbi:MAG: CHRD domain-containing protein [Myxococcota bacterium]
MTAAVLLAAGAPASAETVTYKAALDGASEVPPNDSKGTGMIEAKYDTSSKKLSWTVTYSGLSGAPTAAHLHGPAKPGVNAGPVITLSNLASPMTGEATLTAPQAADLEAGLWYLNIHTAMHQPGEIRGQLMRAR